MKDEIPLTVGQLVAVLLEYNQALPVFAYWEGQSIPLVNAKAVAVEQANVNYPLRAEIDAEFGGG